MNETVSVKIHIAPADRDRLVAELHSLGTLGLEEQDQGVVAYFAAGVLDAAGIARLEALAPRGVEPPEPVPDVDWEIEWRRGLRPRRVGPLWIRPSWCESRGEPELVIDPQQAFGSGEHATTRLSLELLAEALEPGDDVLDVGSGSGVLGLAALRLGAKRALGLDVERAACLNAGENRARNGLALEVFCGTLEALDENARFGLGVANMRWGRLEPWLDRLHRHTTGALVVSGYLDAESAGVHARLASLGLTLVEERSEAESGDVWCASLWHHDEALQSSSRSSSVSSNG